MSKIFIKTKKDYINLSNKNIFNNITSLCFSCSYLGDINFYPPNVKILEFGESGFNENLINIPNTVEEIYFSKYSIFDKEITLPENIKILQFGYQFNRSIDILPEKLKVLIFGSSFQRMLPPFPNSLKYIVFGDMYDSPFQNLPCNLISLSLGYLYNCQLPEFPQKMRKLIIGESYRQKLPMLPKSLKTLYLYSFYKQNMYEYNFLYLREIILADKYININRYKNNIFKVRKSGYRIYHKYNYYIIIKNINPYLKYIIYNNNYIPFEIYNYIYYNFNYVIKYIYFFYYFIVFIVFIIFYCFLLFFIRYNV